MIEPRRLPWLRRLLLCGAFTCAASSTGAAPRPLAAQTVRKDEGAAALGVALRRLGTTKRVLMIGAHPDDENTGLIAELALGAGADVAYLSLTRGEGGQNLIGPELQEGLGLIRSEELLSARRLDGARQFFTRAYDFGFSRTAEETLRHWPRDSVLADVVETVRRWRPDVIISVFSGTPADGHGQHQVAGMLAQEAFDAAADVRRYPAQLARGLAPHRAHHLFQVLWRPTPDARITVETGAWDPLFGRSRHQIAMRSRSRHRSQDFGQLETPGPQRVTLRVMAGDLPPDARSLFAGIDTTLVQHATTHGADDAALRTLAEYENSVTRLRDGFNPLRASAVARDLAAALQLLRGITVDAPALRTRIVDEIADVEDALRIASGISIDVVADTPTPVAGETFEAEVVVWNGGSTPVTIHRVAPLLPAGWSAAPLTDNGGGVVAANSLLRLRYRIDVPRTAAVSEPYFLRAPRSGSLHPWPVADSLRGLPFAPRPVRFAVDLELPTALRMTSEAVHITVDKALGELRRPLLVVAPVDVSVDPNMLAIPAATAGPRTIAVTVRSAAASRIAGSLSLDAPAGWRVEPRSAQVTLAGRDASHTVRFSITPPSDAAADVVAHARFVTANETYDRGFVLIDYPHIEPHALYRAATTRIVTMPVAIADSLRIGFIEGAGDDAATALRQLGAAVDLLDAAALAADDLSRYDAIITGIRAYEVRPDLIAHNQRLLDYADNGGTFIVQYNKYELVDGTFMPFSATMSRPHGRVTNPAAPVSLLQPDHPLLAAPNPITPADFLGWVHERGLYFLDTFDASYQPLLAMSDDGQPSLRGGLVAARVGRGWYVYTGLALFRQLPEGVPGAYRLLANLASLGRTTK